MKCYVISLKNQIRRRTHISSQFTKSGIQFEFQDALDPGVAEEFAHKHGFQIDNSKLTPTELACFMSHVQLWQLMLNHRLPYIAIFEDDIYLGKDAHYYLTQNAWIDPNWHIIDLEYFDTRLSLGDKKLKLPIGDRDLYHLRGPNLGAAGYILSQTGAQHLIHYVKSHPLKPLDQMAFNDYIKRGSIAVHLMQPALVIQEMKLHPDRTAHFPSSLSDERKNKKRTKGVKKLQREISRVHDQVIRLFFAKKAAFK